MKIIFWLLFLLIIYHYVIFPAIVWVLASLSHKKVRKREFYPKVSLIIAAYNEEKVIDAKIKNSFELDYPRDKLEIVVVSDGSKDRTPEIVESYRDLGVVGLFDPPRKGKTAALNRAVAHAEGEVVVFSDANSMYDRKAIIFLTRNFKDPSIGGVCGRKKIFENVDRESSRGDSLFWDFESRVKVQQSRIGSITTGDGEIFAVRKELFTKIPEEVINDDTAITFNIIQQGSRVVYEPEAVSNEEASIVLKDDFNVKARMVCGGYQTLSLYSRMLFPPRNFFAVQFISHKVLRWTMPFFLILFFLTNLFLLDGFYLYFLILQSMFYAMAMVAYLARNSSGVGRMFYFPLYYCSMNVAAIFGCLYYIKGKAGVSIWKKAQR